MTEEGGGPWEALRRAYAPAPRTAVAVAIDDNERAYALAATVQPPGRIVGPLQVTLPNDVKELVRDGRWWVGEKENATAPVRLSRRAQ